MLVHAFVMTVSCYGMLQIVGVVIKKVQRDIK